MLSPRNFKGPGPWEALDSFRGGFILKTNIIGMVATNGGEKCSEHKPNIG